MDSPQKITSREFSREIEIEKSRTTLETEVKSIHSILGNIKDNHLKHIEKDIKSISKTIHQQKPIVDYAKAIIKYVLFVVVGGVLTLLLK